MAIVKRRDRIVVFRLTQEEYKRLEKACDRTGARNLSEYTRRELLETARTEASIERRLSEVQTAISQINQTLRRLVDDPKPVADPKPTS